MTPIAKMVSALAYRHQSWQVFSDLVEMSAVSISNTVDLAQREAREAQYMRIVARYTPDEVAQFPKMLSEVVTALEREPCDVLGAVFQELDLGSKWTGQFFTPQNLADMMARMVISDGVAEIVRDRGYVTVSEPCIGAGVMVVAACKAFKDLGFNYQTQMHVTGVDIDERAVHMAYTQLSLLGIPAIIIHGNSLTLEQRGIWYTPAHVLGLWSSRLRSNAATAIHASAPAIPSRPVAPKLEQLALL